MGKATSPQIAEIAVAGKSQAEIFKNNFRNLY